MNASGNSETKLVSKILFITLKLSADTTHWRCCIVTLKIFPSFRHHLFSGLEKAGQAYTYFLYPNFLNQNQEWIDSSTKSIKVLSVY